MNKLVSIVLPIYNGEKYMRKSIDSVISQTYTDWELLIIDDCSTDGTPEIAKKYAELDHRVHYYRNQTNLRLPKALNRGFSLANGDYLTWTSDDNYYYPDAIEKMKSALDEEEKSFVFASCDVIDSEDNIVEVISVSDNAKKTIVGSNPVGACFMYTREVYDEIGDYDPEMTLVEDLDYWQRICAKYDPVCISEKLYAYRWHDGALTSTMKKDTFNRTLEACLLKNRPAFGKLDWLSKYHYYAGLYKCRVNRHEPQNPYKLKYCYYSALFLLLHRVPGKLRRMFGTK